WETRRYDLRHLRVLRHHLRQTKLEGDCGVARCEHQTGIPPAACAPGPSIPGIAARAKRTKTPHSRICRLVAVARRLLLSSRRVANLDSRRRVSGLPRMRKDNGVHRAD